MFKYDENIKNRLHGDYVDTALTTDNEEEMFELLKLKNPFVNRNLAKNKNSTLKVLTELVDNHVAYTMCVYLAKNKNIDDSIIEKLFKIGEGEYKDSQFTSDMNSILGKR